jgi:hypothetical protein
MLLALVLHIMLRFGGFVRSGVMKTIAVSDDGLGENSESNRRTKVLKPYQRPTLLRGPMLSAISADTPLVSGHPVNISDIRLKRDISQVGQLDNGLALYRYRYIWNDTSYVGVMAQEVAKVVPDAVACGADGYLRVNYGRLGLRLMTWDEYSANDGPRSLACGT